MTRRKKNVIKIAVIFFVALGLLTYFSDEIDRMLLPQIKTCEPVVDYYNNDHWKYYIDECYIPKSAVVFDDDSAVVYAVNEYYDGETPTVYSIEIDIRDSDELYYTVEMNDSLMSGLTATTQLVYHTSKPLSDGERVFITEEN